MSEPVLSPHSATPLAIVRGGRPDPGTLFDGRDFVPQRCAQAVAETEIIRVHHDGRLFRYVEGVYRPDADPTIRVSVRELLGESFRKRHAEEVVAWFRAHPPTIGDSKPAQFINCRSGLLDWASMTLRVATRLF